VRSFCASDRLAAGDDGAFAHGAHVWECIMRLRGEALLALREKDTAETCPYEEQRCVDCMFPSLRLALQSHLRCAFGRVSD
jgi:hypothetical protein